MILETMCSDYGVVPLIKIFKTVFQMIQILGPILAMVSLGLIFFSSVTASDSKVFETNKKKIRNCLVALVVTFFLPIFVNLVMGMTFMVDNFTISECWAEADKINLDPNAPYIEKENHRNHSGSYIINPDDYNGQGTDGNPNDTGNNNSGNSSSSDGNDSGGTPGMSNEGKVSYLTKNGKNWNLNSKIGYSLNQSACSDGKYLYVAFKRDDSHGIIGKFDIEKRQLIKKSGVMNLGHANDMTYDYSRNKVFVTRRENNDISLSAIDPNSLTKSTVKIKIPSSVGGYNLNPIKSFNGIAYDENRGQLLIRGRYASSLLIWVDSNYKAVKAIRIKKGFLIPTQGMEIMNNKVIYSQSLLQYQSSVTSYNRKTGSKIKSTKLGVHGELEGVFAYKGGLYGITYDKRGKNKSLVYKINNSCY